MVWSGVLRARGMPHAITNAPILFYEHRGTLNKQWLQGGHGRQPQFAGNG